MSSGDDPLLCRVELVWVVVEGSQPRLMSRGVGLGRCRAEWAQVDVDRSRPGPMSIAIGPGQCRAESAQADVEWSWPGPNSTSVDSSRFPESAWVDGEWSRP